MRDLCLVSWKSTATILLAEKKGAKFKLIWCLSHVPYPYPPNRFYEFHRSHFRVLKEHVQFPQFLLKWGYGEHR